MTAKIVFVGLDSSEPKLLRKWVAEGLLPNIRKLQERGVSGPLRIPPGMGNGATWPSLYTGVNPARNGRYFRFQFDSATYRTVEFDDDHGHHRDPIWVTLSDAGKRVAVVDVVHAPLCAINGIHIADWTTHGAALPPRSHPPELIGEVIERFGADPMFGSTDVYKRRSAGNCGKLRDEMIARLRRKTALTRHLLGREDWDFFMVSFGEPHDLGHQCWHLHDCRHVDYDAKWARQNGDPIKDIYLELDRSLGEVLEVAGPTSVKVVFAGPGMEPNYTGNHLIERIFDRLERAYSGRSVNLLEETVNQLTKSYVSKKNSLFKKLRFTYRRWVPEKLRRHIRRDHNAAVAAKVDSTSVEAPRPKLSFRKFFRVLHNQNAGALRFNVVGRERYGIVQPGTELDALRKRVIDDLLGILNVESGDKLIAEIVDVHERYHGEYLANMPDLLLVWNRTAPIRVVYSPLIGQVSGVDTSSRTGDHTPNTLLVMSGPGVPTGQLRDNARVEDVAPTVARFAGVELFDVDGSSLVAKRDHRMRKP